jgi:imidazolonepropionase
MPPPFRATLAIRRALLATCDRPVPDPAILPDHAVAIAGDAVCWIGPDSSLAEAVDLSSAEVIDAGGRLVTPGLVDSHTHLVFGDDGARADEFGLLAAGKSYAEIARAGGGIRATMRATRAASDEELLGGALSRARRLLSWGVTTVEVKSGYGESVDEELRLLRVIRELARGLDGEMDVVATALPLHALPSGKDREGWVREVIAAFLPAVAREGLATACDAFVASTAFGVDEARRVLLAARALGLLPRLHADQLADDRAAELAAEVGASSADHLEHVSQAGIAALAQGGVVAGLLPTSTLLLRGGAFAPGRRLVDGGVAVSLATNANPGSAMSENVGLSLSLACLENGLTPGEALWAATRGGARALRREGAGRISAGGPADLVLWGARSPAHLCWHAAVNHVLQVVKAGRVVHRAVPPATADCGAEERVRR